MVAHIVTQSADLSGRDSRRSACARRTLRPLQAPRPESPKLTGARKTFTGTVTAATKNQPRQVCGPKPNGA